MVRRVFQNQIVLLLLLLATTLAVQGCSTPRVVEDPVFETAPQPNLVPTPVEMDETLSRAIDPNSSESRTLASGEAGDATGNSLLNRLNALDIEAMDAETRKALMSAVQAKGLCPNSSEEACGASAAKDTPDEEEGAESQDDDEDSDPGTSEKKKRRKRKKGSRSISSRGGRKRTTGTIDYVVKNNDTLMKISFELFGNVYRWREIYDENRSKVSRFNSISPGTILRITLSDVVQVRKNGNPYLIQKRDTLYKISGKVYGTPRRWWSLWDNNRELIHDPNRIYAGFTLYYRPDPRVPASVGPSLQMPALTPSAAGSMSPAPTAPAVPAAPISN